MGLFTGLASFFTGGGVREVANVVDDLYLSEEEKQNLDQKDLTSARDMTAPSHDSGFDIMVDCISRLIRPGVTIWLIGGFSQLWQLPKPETIDPFWQSAFWLVITFWFGGRALMKDLPKTIGAIMALWKR